MKTIPVKRLASVLAAMLPVIACQGPAGEPSDAPAESVATTELGISLPAASFGVYCNTVSSDGTWKLVTRANQSANPCAGLSGTVQRQGFWSISNRNMVVTQCDGAVNLQHGVGIAPIDAAKTFAAQRANCSFTISAQKMPIFTAPMVLNPTVVHNNGFDHARPTFAGSDYTIDTTQFGGTNPAATKVDYKGKVPTWPIDNHAGHDWPTSVTISIFAAAAGQVVLVRKVTVTPCRCTGLGVGLPAPQNEIYILHRVTSPVTGVEEQFLTFYAHMSSLQFPEGSFGQNVVRNQVIGTSGSTGCSTDPHLHFGVARLTNTSSEFKHQLSIPPTEAELNGLTWIDPFGWQVTCTHHNDCFDPWSWKALPLGAPNVNLWDPSASLPPG